MIDFIVKLYQTLKLLIQISNFTVIIEFFENFYFGMFSKRKVIRSSSLEIVQTKNSEIIMLNSFFNRCKTYCNGDTLFSISQKILGEISYNFEFAHSHWHHTFIFISEINIEIYVIGKLIFKKNVNCNLINSRSR